MKFYMAEISTFTILCLCSFRNAEDSAVFCGDGIAPPTAPPTFEKVPLSLRLRKVSSSESEVIPASPSKAGKHTYHDPHV